jgi:hypothetical protein
MRLPQAFTQEQLARETREQRIRDAARKVADSGLYTNWRSVQVALVDRGYSDAPRVLDSEGLRSLLNTRCAIARRRV